MERNSGDLGIGKLSQNSELSTEELEQVIAESGLASLLHGDGPVDIKEVAMALGVTSISAMDMPFAGMLLPSEDSFRILVNRNHAVVRQRFSCAHEIAHVLLNSEHSHALRQSPTSCHDRLEKNCEAMAAMLLMPNPAFSDLSRGENPGIRKVVELAQSFVTSIQATAIRYVDVLKENCVLIVSELQRANTDFNLKVRWSHQNMKRRSGKSMYFVPSSVSMNVNTAKAALRTNKIETGTEEFRLGGLRLKAYTESKGFGARGYRYVLTLVFPNRQSHNATFSVEANHGTGRISESNSG